MLVVSRKVGQKIVVGSEIVLTIVRISRDKVKVGIDAPTDIPVLREELEPFNADAQVSQNTGRAA